MGKIDEALATLTSIQNRTERALELAGLLSTLFKLRGVSLIVSGDMAFRSYANTNSPDPELELSSFAGNLSPRLLQEIMGGQLGAKGAINRWTVAGIYVRFQGQAVIARRDLCRDFASDHGVIKLWPAEEITAERILAAIYPGPNPRAHDEALTLLTNALAEAFRMDWIALRSLCHQPDFLVGEELTQLRIQAKQEADALGLLPDAIGAIPAESLQTSQLPAF